MLAVRGFYFLFWVLGFGFWFFGGGCYELLAAIKFAQKKMRFRTREEEEETEGMRLVSMYTESKVSGYHRRLSFSPTC